MNKRDELIVKYANDLREKCNHNPDMDLLRKVTIACGPSIYNKDSSTISSTSKSELETVRYNFLIKKLGLSVSDKLEAGLKNKHRRKKTEMCSAPGKESSLPLSLGSRT